MPLCLANKNFAGLFIFIGRNYRLNALNNTVQLKKLNILYISKTEGRKLFSDFLSLL